MFTCSYLCIYKSVRAFLCVVDTFIYVVDAFICVFDRSYMCLKYSYVFSNTFKWCSNILHACVMYVMRFGCINHVQFVGRPRACGALETSGKTRSWLFIKVVGFATCLWRFGDLENIRSCVLSKLCALSRACGALETSKKTLFLVF